MNSKEFEDLHALAKRQMNRQLACEAMLSAMLHRMDPRYLAGLEEEYHAALDRIASELEPAMQMPQEWSQFADVLEELQRFHQGQQRGIDQRHGAG